MLTTELTANLSRQSLCLGRTPHTRFASDEQEEMRRYRAELLMGQVLFISYLEHRDIVGATYRARRGVSQLHSLIRNANRSEVGRLIDFLRQDFNGDFLGDDRHDPWAALNDTGFALLDSFLRRTEMSTGQQNFWNYDFSFIPVELLSGLYETFLSTEEQAKTGAYYTPRNLAMLAVDQAFLTSENPLDETIFDGACGSGNHQPLVRSKMLSLFDFISGFEISLRLADQSVGACHTTRQLAVGSARWRRREAGPRWRL